MKTTRATVTNAPELTNSGDVERFRLLLGLLRAGKFDVEIIVSDVSAWQQLLPGITSHEQPGTAARAPALLRRPAQYWRCCIAMLSPWLPGIHRLLPGSQASAVAALRRADVIVAAPGGYLADASVPLPGQLAQLWIAAMARAPLIFAPVSIGHVSGRWARWTLRRILRRAHHLSVREAASDARCQDLGAKPVRCNDLAFLNAAFSVPPAERPPPGYVVASPVKWEPGGTQSDANQRQYVAGMIATLGRVAMHAGLPVRLIVQRKRDSNTARQIANGLTVPVEILRDLDAAGGLPALLGQSYCWVGSQSHTAIAALAADCPVAVMVDAMPGIRDIFALYGLEDLCFAMPDLSAHSAADTLMRWGDDRTGFRQRGGSLRDSLRRIGNPFVQCLGAAGKASTNRR